jgi:hypothetical protein
MAEVTHHTPVNIDERYTFTPELRKRLFTAIGIGLLLFIAGILLLVFGPHEAHGGEGAAAEGHSFHWTQRLWANLWLNNVFFTGIAVIGVFFVAFQYVAYAGWSSSIKRVPEAFGAFLPISGVMMVILFVASNLIGEHHLFHWITPGDDEILLGKKGYLNVPFYLIRMVIYFAAWYVMWRLLRKESLLEDQNGGLVHYDKSITLSAIFIIIFAVTSSMSAWDWVMSIDAHWFSTMFGWYMFASWFVAGLSTITLTVIFLKEAGYLSIVNQNHLHDLGKFMFAFSIFWTYVRFAQFLLIYYANIPEETIYFIERLHGYGGKYTIVFFLNIFINFLFPFLVLMTRDAKRQTIFLKVVASGLLIGHWLDFYMMVMPGTVGENGGFGLLEFGTVLIYASVFILVVATTLSLGPLIAKNHPMLEESIHHDI